MAKKLKDLFKEIKPLNAKQKTHIRNLTFYLDKEKLDEVKGLLKLSKIGVYYETINTNLISKVSYPQMNVLTEDKNVTSYIEDINKIIEKNAYETSFINFSKNAYEKITKILSPELQGYEQIRKAIVLQIASSSRVHMLLLGDPGTGKTELIRAGEKISPISSFGLGSGISGVGLVASKKGKEITPGLLPMAHGGVCFIDELNLMKKEDRGGLLNAMEKGFVSYDKGNSHVKLKSDVKILATANPKGDSFVSNNIDLIKSQIPFDPALFSRFHLVYIFRKPNIESFLTIARKIIRGGDSKPNTGDLEYAKKYMEYVGKHNPKFNKKFEPMLIDLLEELKQNQKKIIVDINPRTVHGLIALARAKAAISLKNEVDQDDLAEVFGIYKKSLNLLGESKKRK